MFAMPMGWKIRRSPTGIAATALSTAGTADDERGVEDVFRLALHINRLVNQATRLKLKYLKFAIITAG
jgi:hypothetical protein